MQKLEEADFAPPERREADLDEPEKFAGGNYRDDCGNPADWGCGLLLASALWA